MAMQKSKFTHKETYDYIINRLYHEDYLLSQRTYNFLMTYAFLSTALAVVFTNSDKTLCYIISILGLTLAFFQFVLCHRNQRAIEVMREYLRLVEPFLNLKVDNALYQFYSRGEVITDYGTIHKQKSKSKIMNQVFPWLGKNSSSLTLVSLWLPSVIAIFWGSIILIIPGGNRTYSIAALSALVVILVVLVLTHRLFSAKPAIAARHEVDVDSIDHDGSIPLYPLAELIDRLAIVKLKIEYVKEEEKSIFVKEYEHYENGLEYYETVIGERIDKKFHTDLYDVNQQIWNLEGALRRGELDHIDRREIGDLAIQIRDQNRLRMKIKTEIVDRYGYGFRDPKVNQI